VSTQRPAPAGESVPPLLRGLIDDAAVFPPGNATLPDAVAGHRVHRASWYADMVGPLLVPASAVASLSGLLASDDTLMAGIVGDTGLTRLPDAVRAGGPRVDVRQVEISVAKRGEDPQPGLTQLIAMLGEMPDVTGYAEIPLTFGLLGALDTLVGARASGVGIAAKFRTGGLAAELFPTPIELAAVICACRDRDLPFKLTAGLHHAIRHADPETGFVHHGFLGVLAGTLAAVDDAEVAEVAELLAAVDPVPLLEAVRRRIDEPRPLWVGFGTCSIDEPVTDLRRLGLLSTPITDGSTPMNDEAAA
jgi:hypothetical protein